MSDVQIEMYREAGRLNPDLLEDPDVHPIIPGRRVLRILVGSQVFAFIASADDQREMLEVDFREDMTNKDFEEVWKGVTDGDH